MGTTDARSELTPLPLAPAKDVEFIVKESANYLQVDPEDLKRDITAAWCGIRPLVRDPESKDTSKLSRDHVVEVDEHSGLITIAGGKWTTSRLMAEHTVDKALNVHRGKIHAKHPCRTWFLKLIGTHGSASDEVGATKTALHLARDFQLEFDDAVYLVRNYGCTLARSVCEMGKANKSLQPIIPNQRVLKAELQWAVEHEMAESVTDVIGHRTRLAFIDPRETKRVLGDIVEEIGRLKQWSTERKIVEYESSARFLDSMTYEGGSDLPASMRKRVYAPIDDTPQAEG